MIFYRSFELTLPLFIILVLFFVHYYFFFFDLLWHIFFTLTITIEFWLSTFRYHSKKICSSFYIYIYISRFSPIQIITSSISLSFRLSRSFAWHVFPIFRIAKHRTREKVVNVEEIFVRSLKFAFKHLSIRNVSYICRYVLFVYVANTRIYPSSIKRIITQEMFYRSF